MIPKDLARVLAVSFWITLSGLSILFPIKYKRNFESTSFNSVIQSKKLSKVFSFVTSNKRNIQTTL